MKLFLFGASAAFLLGAMMLVPTRAAAAGKAASGKAASTRATSMSRSGVQFKASTDARSYTPGQPIQVSMAAINTAKRAATLRFSSGQRFDLVLYRFGESAPVYTWSASRMFIQMLGNMTLGAGQSRTFDATLGDEMGALSPGKYRLEARLTDTSGGIAAAPIWFAVKDLALSMTARAAEPRYKLGTPIEIDMAVKNLTGKTNVVPFDSGMTYDVMITDENKNLVWSYGANLRFIRVLGSVTWEAGETKNFSATWNGVALPRETTSPQLEPGRYKIQAVLASTPRVSAPPIYVYLTN